MYCCVNRFELNFFQEMGRRDAIIPGKTSVYFHYAYCHLARLIYALFCGQSIRTTFAIRLRINFIHTTQNCKEIRQIFVRMHRNCKTSPTEAFERLPNSAFLRIRRYVFRNTHLINRCIEWRVLRCRNLILPS